MNCLAFPKKQRLLHSRQFKAVLDRGRRAGDGLLRLYMAENGRGYPRLGVSVGKSSGPAVVRNRLKRLLREAFRQSQDQIPKDLDYVLMVSPSLSRRLKRPEQRTNVLATLTFQRVQKSFLALVQVASRAPRRHGTGAVQRSEMNS